MSEQDNPQPSPTIWPLGFAVGIAVLLVGLIVSPLWIGSIGGAITIVSGVFWVTAATAELRGRVPAVEPEGREPHEAGAGPIGPPADAGEASMPPLEPGER